MPGLRRGGMGELDDSNEPGMEQGADSGQGLNVPQDFVIVKAA